MLGGDGTQLGSSLTQEASAATAKLSKFQQTRRKGINVDNARMGSNARIGIYSKYLIRIQCKKQQRRTRTQAWRTRAERVRSKNKAHDDYNHVPLAAVSFARETRFDVSKSLRCALATSICRFEWDELSTLSW